MRYSFFLSFFLLFSGSVFADGYYWTSRVVGGTFSSAQAACAAFNGFVVYAETEFNAVCSRPGENSPSSIQVDKHLDTCPAPTKYDYISGKCVTPPPTEDQKCSALKDTPIPAFKWDSNTDDPPQTISNGGCEATVVQARCSYVSSGKAVCTGRATYTGKALSKNPNGTVADCSGDACTAGSPQPETKNQDCVYSSNGSGSSSCTATNSQSNPGTSQCGSVNGAYTCIENPKATATSSTLNSTKTPTSNPNGTLTVVQDDTVTTVKCSGRSCTTTTSTSTGTTVTNSSGQVISHDSTCKGGNCSGTGQATQPSNSGTGSGTGSGNSGDGDDDQGSGNAGSLTDPSNGSFDGQASDWDGKIEKAKKDFKDGLDKMKDSFQPIGQVSLGGGAGQLYCPPAVQIPYLNRSISFCADNYAGSLSWLASAIYAGCALIALFIIFM